MSDTENQTIKAKTLRAFTDAGTETSFTADQEITLSQGEFANYQAAGLVEAIAPAESVETKTRTTRA